MEVDWDLHAVVRGCKTTSANTTTTTTTSNTTASFKADFVSQSWVSSFNSEQSNHLFSFADTFEARNGIEELHELYKPFVPKYHPISPPTSITSKPISSSSSPSPSPITTSAKDQTQFKQRQQQQLKQSHVGSVTSSTTANSHTRSKRRKNQLKRVCHVPAEGLSSDVWAWRKYGQKPIKGSPYPRGYYRCSTSKGCLARKQVERNRSDPGMFIVTYTAEHNHPAPTHKNSLAGTTRQKPFTAQNTAASESNKPPSPTSSGKPTFSSSSPATSMEEETVPQSTNTESRERDLLEEEEEEEEEEEFGVSDIGISDDLFVGLEGLGSEESLTDRFPASFGLPWVAKNAATTAAGGI